MPMLELVESHCGAQPDVLSAGVAKPFAWSMVCLPRGARRPRRGGVDRAIEHSATPRSSTSAPGARNVVRKPLGLRSTHVGHRDEDAPEFERER